MKTLLEHIINELRLSNAKTGNKLKEKTFAALEKGDKLYWVYPPMRKIVSATITEIVHSTSHNRHHFFYDANGYSGKTMINDINMNKTYTDQEALPNCIIAANLDSIYKEIPDAEKYHLEK